MPANPLRERVCEIQHVQKHVKMFLRAISERSAPNTYFMRLKWKKYVFKR